MIILDKDKESKLEKLIRENWGDGFIHEPIDYIVRTCEKCKKRFRWNGTTKCNNCQRKLKVAKIN